MKSCILEPLYHLAATTFIFLSVCIEWTVISAGSASAGSHVYYKFPVRKAREISLDLADIHVVTDDSAASKPKIRDATQQRNNIRGRPGLGYYIQVDIGTPPQTLNVLIDTGSSNFAVAAAPQDSVSTYFHTNGSSSYQDQDLHVKVPYTQGEWSGDMGSDVVQLISIGGESFRANIATITESTEFFMNGSSWQGILGLGYADIARPDSSILPFFDSMTEQTSVDDIFTLQLCGTLDAENSTGNATDNPIEEVLGTMTIGDMDESLYRGPMQYAPIRQEWFYEVIITDLKVAGQSLGMDCKEYNFDKTIVDSGTTNLRLPERVFQAARQAIEDVAIKMMPEIPEDFWTGDVLMCPTDSVLPYEPFHWFPNLTLDLQSTEEGKAFSLVVSPRQYLRHDYDQEDQKSCYKFGISHSANTAGAVIGAVVMEGFYVVFDRENKQVGFAKSTCPGVCANHDNCSASPPLVSEPFNINFDAKDCGYSRSTKSDPALTITAYVLAGVCVVCLIPVLAMILIHQINRRCKGCHGRGTVDHHRLDQDERLETVEPDEGVP